jgi:two-component system sensor histidine kinase/response regulator
MENVMPPDPLVLVIDDEDSMREACAQILLRGRYRVETAADGAAGIRMIRDLRPDVVIVDLKMPGLSGLEVLDQLAAFDPAIVGIVITGYATIDSAIEAMKRGAYDFLPKPFSPEELRIIITRGLERRRLFLEAEALRREKRLLEDNVITLVSHQLRSPLVAIQQFFEVMLADASDDSGSRFQDMIRRAGERLEGLLQLINDWLDLARIEQGGLTGKMRPVNVAAIVDRQIAFLAPAARQSQVTLDWTSPSGPVAGVLGDESCLEQVFTNLIGNAIAYNKPQGRVRIDLKEEPEDIVIEIQDTGIGIAKEHLPLIFDQFYRVSRSGAKRSQGSGLGLPIAKKIIEAHRGLIDVVSTPDVGTTFTVRLPKAQDGPTEK